MEECLTTVDSERQSLEARTGAARHELLQLFADFEIALTGFLDRANRAPADLEKRRTFGEKLREAIKLDQSLKAHDRLIALRNLLAHAKFDIVKIEKQYCVLLQVAECASETNARIVRGDRWPETHAAWRDALKAALDDLKPAASRPRSKLVKAA